MELFEGSFSTYGHLFLIDEQHYEEFCQHLKVLTIKRSEFFLEQDQFCDFLGFLDGGMLRSYYINDRGEDINFNFHMRGSFFSDYESLILGKKTTINIKACMESKIILLNKKDLNNLYKKDPYWQEFGRKMAEVIYLQVKKRMEELLCLSPEKRFSRLLLENPEIFQLVPQKHIASYLGVRPQSLSRLRTRILKR